MVEVIEGEEISQGKCRICKVFFFFLKKTEKGEVRDEGKKGDRIECKAENRKNWK